MWLAKYFDGNYNRFLYVREGVSEVSNSHHASLRAASELFIS